MNKQTLVALILGENFYPDDSIGHENYNEAMCILMNLELSQLKRLYLVIGLKEFSKV